MEVFEVMIAETGAVVDLAVMTVAAVSIGVDNLGGSDQSTAHSR